MYVLAEPTSRNLESNKKSQVQQKVVKKLPVSDLRGKLSGVASQRPQLSSTVQVPKPVKEVIKSNKPVQKRDPTPTTAPPDIKKPSAPAPVPAPSALPKQSQNKVRWLRIYVVFSYKIVSWSVIVVPLFVLLEWETSYHHFSYFPFAVVLSCEYNGLHDHLMLESLWCLYNLWF